MKKLLVLFLVSVAIASQAQTNYLGPLKDKVAHAAGSYESYLSPWNTAGLPAGGTYAEFLAYDPINYPNNQQIYWSWPSTPPTSRGVYNFLAINFGNYYDGTVPVPITPKQVGSITKLSQTFNLSLSGNTNGYDAVIDLFTTARPNDFTNRRHEIEIFLHTPAYTGWYVQSVTQGGTYRDAGGRAWTVAVDMNATPQDILIMPANQSDILAATIDIKAMFAWLIRQNVMSSDEYFNGLGLGVEVNHDTGAFSINSLSTTYDGYTSQPTDLVTALKPAAGQSNSGL